MGAGDGPALRDVVAVVAALAGVRDGQVAVALGCPDLLVRALGAVTEAPDGTAHVVVSWEPPDLDVVARLLRPGGKAVVPDGTDAAGWTTRYAGSGWLVLGRTMPG